MGWEAAAELELDDEATGSSFVLSKRSSWSMLALGGFFLVPERGGVEA